MANWYTSTRNGNDTTGNGTIATPYATIFKAASLASTGDTINTEGDALVDSGVTGTFSGNSTTITTSSSLTGVLSAGSIFTIDDPVWGTGKVWFKVRSITGSTITVNQTYAIRGTFNIRYIATPSYSSNSTTAFPEDLSSLTLDGINFEGGWNEDFTSQDRITWSTYVTTSSVGSTTFLRLNTSNSILKQSNLSFNNFGTGGNIMFGTGQVTGGVYNNLYTAYGQIYASATSTINTLYISAGEVTRPLVYTNAQPMVIDTVYFNSGTGGFGTSVNAFKINNFYTKAVVITLTRQLIATLNSGSCDIDMLYIDWQQLTTEDGSIGIMEDRSPAANAILRGITHQGNYVGTGKKIVSLRLLGDSNCQIATTQNVDDWGIQSFEGSFAACNSFAPIKDVEGDKQYFGGGNVIFADASEFSTGSNSLRVSKAISIGNRNPVPIKSFYNADATAKTITIRAKAAVASTVNFGIMPNGAYYKPDSGGITNVLDQTSFTITDTWADYTVNLTSDNAGYLEDSFVNVCILASGEWASEYVWIDSVTVA